MQQHRDWSPAELRYYEDEKAAIDVDWVRALHMSKDSGFPYIDREGRNVPGRRPCVVTETIDLYFRVFGHKGKYKILKSRVSAVSAKRKHHARCFENTPPWQARKTTPD